MNGSFTSTIPVSISVVTTQIVFVPDMPGYSVCSIIINPAAASGLFDGKIKLQFAAGYPLGSRSILKRNESAFCSKYCIFSNIVSPGTSSTPPTITLPGSPQACRSTACIILDIVII